MGPVLGVGRELQALETTVQILISSLASTVGRAKDKDLAMAGKAGKALEMAGEITAGKETDKAGVGDAATDSAITITLEVDATEIGFEFEQIHSKNLRIRVNLRSFEEYSQLTPHF